MRWIGRILGLVAVLLIVAVAGLLFMPTERIAALVESRFEAATGRSLSIAGDVRPGFWPEIGVRAGPVTIANADWASDQPMIEAEALSVGIAWAGLFGGDIRVTGVELTRPVIRLERTADGRGNWEIAPGQAETAPEPIIAGDAETPEASASGRTVSLDKITVKDGSVIYAAEGASPVTLSEIDATLTLPDMAGEATLSLAAQANGEPISAALTISRFAAFLEEGAVPVTLEAGIGQGTMSYEGEAGLQPLSATGRLQADLEGIGPLTRAAGARSAEVTAGFGRDRLRFDGGVAYAGDTLSLSDAALTLDSNDFRGDLDLTFGAPRPRLVGRVSTGPLDLSGGKSKEDSRDAAKKDEQEGPEGWSTEPIDVSALRALDADVFFEAPEIALSSSHLGRTALDLDLDDGRLVTTIRELSAYDGAVDGQVVINGRSGLSASADLAGSAIAISRLFAELLDFDRLIALGDMEISVMASGSSMDALMNDMNGDGSFRFGAGELMGLDLVGMIRNLDPGFVGEGNATIFDEITGTFRIVDGVVINDNLKLLAPLLTATGSGRVGLGAQTLNYRIVPKLLSGENEGISVPVLITGTWSAPRIRLDLEGVMQAAADDEIEEAKDRLEQKARDALLEELGAGADADPEKELKQKLGKELTKGLRKLFD